MSDYLEPPRYLFCDMCENFIFPESSSYQTGICPVVVDEIGRKATRARTCEGFTPARRCGCCAHYVIKPYQTNGKCEVTRKRRSSGSKTAEVCWEWEEWL